MQCEVVFIFGTRCCNIGGCTGLWLECLGTGVWVRSLVQNLLFNARSVEILSCLVNSELGYKSRIYIHTHYMYVLYIHYTCRHIYIYTHVHKISISSICKWYLLKSEATLATLLLFFFFWPHLWHKEVPEPKPQRWQCRILNPLSHQGTLETLFKSYAITNNNNHNNLCYSVHVHICLLGVPPSNPQNWGGGGWTFIHSFTQSTVLSCGGGEWGRKAK